MASTPYNAMYNSPLVYNDPNGDCPQCIIGGIVGGLLNLGSQALQGNVTGIKSGLSYFAIGAGAGVLASTGNLGAARALTVGGNKVVQIATGKFSSENLKSPMGLLQTGLSVAGDFGLPGLTNTIAKPLASGLASLSSNLFNTTVSGGSQWTKQAALNAVDDVAYSVGMVDDIVVSASRSGSKKLLTQFAQSTIDDAVALTMKQKSTHIFANKLHPKPWLNELATRLGGQQPVIQSALQNANGRIIANAKGIFNTNVTVGGVDFTIRGFINQGRPIINSIFIP